MKKLVSTFLFLCILSLLHAQYHEGGFSARYLMPNYQFPISNDLKSVDFTDGAEIEYIHPLSKAFNLAIPLKLAVANYPKDQAGNVQEGVYFGSDLLIQMQHLRPKSFLNPYLYTGIGFNLERWEMLNASIPLGAGIDFRIARNTFFAPKIEYRLALQDSETRNNLQAGLGLKVLLVKEEPKPVLPPLPPDRDGDGIPDTRDQCPDQTGPAATNGCPDRDGDGIADKDDPCPDQAGPAATRGCPDRDGDGVADKDDQCPDQAGLVALNGCPDRDRDGIADAQDQCPDQAGSAALNGCPDRDGDGVADKDDQCPDQAGLASLNGCPDRDGDGVIDREDRCPNTPGPASNGGCPELKQEDKEVLDLAVRAVQFETGRATLRASSYPSLDKIVDLMRRYPDFSLSISGHTDSQGSDAVNQILSENRANACRDYIISKGIAAGRLSAAGYGETRPIATNNTVAGREKNRRVEFELKPGE